MTGICDVMGFPRKPFNTSLAQISESAVSNTTTSGREVPASFMPSMPLTAVIRFKSSRLAINCVISCMLTLSLAMTSKVRPEAGLEIKSMEGLLGEQFEQLRSSQLWARYCTEAGEAGGKNVSDCVVQMLTFHWSAPPYP